MIGIIINIWFAGRLTEQADTRCLWCNTVISMMLAIWLVIQGRFCDAVYMAFLLWLMTIAYADYLTGYVYSVMEFAAIAPVTAAVCLTVCRCSVTGNTVPVKEIVGLCTAISVLFVLLALLGSTGCLGAGDVAILRIVIIMMLCRQVSVEPDCLSSGAGHAFAEGLIRQIQFIYMSVLLFVIRYIRHINWRKLSLDCSRPFVPSIYMAAVLSLFG